MDSGYFNPYNYFKLKKKQFNTVKYATNEQKTQKSGGPSMISNLPQESVVGYTSSQSNQPNNITYWKDGLKAGQRAEAVGGPQQLGRGMNATTANTTQNRVVNTSSNKGVVPSISLVKKSNIVKKPNLVSHY
jgi:hypothetical protein